MAIQHDVFIIHAEEDAALAQELARALKKDGYSTWFYRRATASENASSADTDAIKRSKCVAILISRNVYASREIDREVVQAHQSRKPIMPVLCGVSPADWQERKPEWRAAMGAASPISLILPTNIAGALPQIRRGLAALGIRPEARPPGVALEAPEARYPASNAPESGPPSGVLPADSDAQRWAPGSHQVTVATAVVTDDTPHPKEGVSDILISYAREDRPRVQRLAEALAARGWSVWWDRDLVPGPRFRDVIERQLESVRCVVVVWSTDAVESDWVLDEAADAHKRGKLVAVRIDDVDLPLGFGQIQTADLVGWEGDAAQAEFRKLIVGAEALIGRAPVPLPRRTGVAIKVLCIAPERHPSCVGGERSRDRRRRCGCHCDYS